MLLSVLGIGRDPHQDRRLKQLLYLWQTQTWAQQELKVARSHLIVTDLQELKVVFDRCFEAGVEIAICTDNAGLHNVRLPFEYENLLTHNIIGFEQLQECQAASFRHAFAWPHDQHPTSMLTHMLKVDSEDSKQKSNHSIAAHSSV